MRSCDTDQIGAGPCERSASRSDYRNGTYKRRLSTRLGTIIVQKTDQELEHCRTRAIEDKYEYFFLDGIYDKVRDLGLERKALLYAPGMTIDIRRSLMT